MSVVIHTGYKFQIMQSERTCDQCRASFRSRYGRTQDVFRHWLSQHATSLSSRRLHDQRKAIRNTQQRQAEEERQIVCDGCRASISGRNLFRHWLAIHDDSSSSRQLRADIHSQRKAERRLQVACDRCKFTTYRSVNFFKHWHRYHNRSSRPLPRKTVKTLCDDCALSKEFRHRATLIRHLASHGTLPYTPQARSKVCCDECSRVVDRSHFHKHLYTYHGYTSFLNPRN